MSASHESQASASATAQNKYLCDCELPSRICTSKTKENPGKKFRVCPNSLKPGKKCSYWEWVEESKPRLEDEVATIKEEVTVLKKQVDELMKKDVRRHRVKISCNLL